MVVDGTVVMVENIVRHLTRIGEADLKAAPLQHIEQRDPVHSGRLHDDRLDPAGLSAIRSKAILGGKAGTEGEAGHRKVIHLSDSILGATSFDATLTVPPLPACSNIKYL